MPIHAPNTLAQQLTKACARAVTGTNTIVRLGNDESGLLAILTSARDARLAYTIRRDQASGTLTCSCPARVVCKHIGLLLVQYGVPYHTTGRPDEMQPVVPGSNPPEPAADEPNTQDEKPYPFSPVEEARLVAFRRVAVWLTSLEAPATEEREASVALMLAERSERTLAMQTFSQEERLRALAYLPVALAAYVVVLGPAHAWQWHQAKEEQWDRYQAARIGGSLCAPQSYRSPAGVDTWTLEEWRAELRRVGGTPEEVLTQPTRLGQLVAQLRGGLSIGRDFTYTPEAPFAFPMATCAGEHDQAFSPTTLEGWREQTTSAYTAFRYPEAGHLDLLQVPAIRSWVVLDVMTTVQHWLEVAA